MGNIDWTGVWVTAIMYAIFILIGWFASKKVKTGSASELLVAGRSLPILMLFSCCSYRLD